MTDVNKQCMERYMEEDLTKNIGWLLSTAAQCKADVFEWEVTETGKIRIPVALVTTKGAVADSSL